MPVQVPILVLVLVSVLVLVLALMMALVRLVLDMHNHCAPSNSGPSKEVAKVIVGNGTHIPNLTPQRTKRKAKAAQSEALEKR